MDDQARQLNHNPAGLRAASDAALAALRRDEPPASVIKQLLGAGADPQTVGQALQIAYATLKHDAEQARAVQVAAIRAALAEGLRAEQSDAALEQRLLERGVPAEVAVQLVRAARQRYTQASAAHAPGPRARLTANLLMTGLIVLALLLGWSRVRQELSGQALVSGESSPVLWAEAAQPSVTAVIAPAVNAVVVAQRLNVRSGPGREYPLLFQLPAQTPLRVIARTHGALRYKIVVEDGREAWVRGDPTAVQLLTAPESIPFTPID